MKKNLTKLWCLIIAISICLAVPSYAATLSESYDVTHVNNNSLIPVDCAEQIALLFIKDMIISTTTVDWTEQTSVVNIETLYDEKNNISAYSFELSKGYVIVAAYLDYPSLILEWSDKESPLYKEVDSCSKCPIVYLGGLSYYKDIGNSNLLSIDGTRISKASVENFFSKIRTNNNLRANLSTYFKEKSLDGVSFLTANDSTIEDPIAHANTWYNGPFTCCEFYNNWQSWFSSPRVTSDFDSIDGQTYDNHCGPTAITNLVIVYGNRNDIDSIKRKTSTSIFKNIASIGTSHFLPYYVNSSTSLGGTPDYSAKNYIIAAFSYYGINIAVSSSQKSITYENLRATLLGGDLAYLMLNSHECYGKHHVVGYAYTRLVSSTTGAYKTYVKIADGWSRNGRYLDLLSLDGMNYWAVDV